MYKIVKVIKLFKKLPQRILEDFFMIIIINTTIIITIILLIYLLLLLLLLLLYLIIFFIKNVFIFFMFRNVPEGSVFWVLSTGVDKTWNTEDEKIKIIFMKKKIK